jgi:hypothetical protein
MNMKEQMTLISMVLGVSLILLTSIAFAGDIPNELRIAVKGMSPYIQESMQSTAAWPGWNPFEASWLIGHGVFSPTGTYPGAAPLYRYSVLKDKKVESLQGQTVARVDDLIISPRGLNVFLGLSDVAGESGQRVAVPFRLLSKKGEDTFPLNVSKEKLASAPNFSHYFEMNIHPRMAENSYPYFGVQPSWNE